MATRSLIAIENSDNTIEAIFCHWNGAPEHNGKMLFEHFSDGKKLKELISLGNLSELYPRLHPIGKHSYDKREKGTTIAKHRDKGDSWEDTQPQTFSTLKEFLNDLGGYYDVEFIYVFTKQGQWTVYPKKLGEPLQKKQDLETVLKMKKP